ncbi:MAG TPA: hypothetical protein VKB47_08615 [Terracidiphilus sp.]|nr:hypothetical protein [Terracidiphilus sp.]
MIEPVIDWPRPTPRPYSKCATSNCDGVGRPILDGYCRDCFGFRSSFALEAKLKAERCARRARRLVWWRRNGAYIVAAVAVEWLLVWEFRDWIIELGRMWFFGGAK